MTKDLQEDVRKSVDIDVQNGDASRQRLLEDSTLATGSSSTNERMISPNTSKEVLPGMEITDNNVPKHKPLNWCGTVEKGEIVHVPGTDERSAEIADLITGDGKGSFGEGETRDRIKDLLEEACSNGTLEELLDKIKVGDDIDFSKFGFQQQLKFDFDPATYEVSMTMQFWPVKMGPKQVDSIKLFS